jgi:hypothetical protein
MCARVLNDLRQDRAILRRLMKTSKKWRDTRRERICESQGQPASELRSFIMAKS